MARVRKWLRALSFSAWCVIVPGLAEAAPSPSPPRKPPLMPSGRNLDPSRTGSVKPPVSFGRLPYQKIRPPARPAPSLPPDAARQPQDMGIRHIIADGATSDEIKAGKDDPELRLLLDAEQQLFPKPSFLPEKLGWRMEFPLASGFARPEVINSGLPPLLSSPPYATKAAILAEDADWLRGLVVPNIPAKLDPTVVRYLKFYRDHATGQRIVRAWVKKSGRFEQTLKAELAKSGLPTDLVWLSLIESGHNPAVFSHAGAAGLWQFMPDAGRNYGLTVDRWVDERLDPVRATQAACLHLSDLYSRFGSWELAMAAYNMGFGGLLRAIRKFNTNDFWQLTRYEAGVPWETALYVPKIIAMAIVMNNKQAFGVGDVQPDQAEAFDSVRIGPGVPLEQIARAADIPNEAIASLNPQYISGRTPPAPQGVVGLSFQVRVPQGKSAAVLQALAQAPAEEEQLELYTTRLGDTVEAIATARGTTEARLRAINQFGQRELLKPGATLLVPILPLGREPTNETVVVYPRELRYTNRSKIFYRVASGDTLSGLAAAFGVTTGELAAWNAIDPQARLQSGMALQVYVDKSKDLSNVRYVTQDQANTYLVGSPEFYEYFEGLNGRRRVVVTANGRDTLAGIGKRYGLSAGWMERINRRSRTDVLKAGESVVVYIDRNSPSVAQGPARPVTPALLAPPEYPETFPTVPREGQMPGTDLH